MSFGGKDIDDLPFDANLAIEGIAKYGNRIINVFRSEIVKLEIVIVEK